MHSSIQLPGLTPGLILSTLPARSKVSDKPLKHPPYPPVNSLMSRLNPPVNPHVPMHSSIQLAGLTPGLILSTLGARSR
jgi:hypothetical protein